MEGSRDEVVRYLRLTEAEFQISGERTSAAKSQDWAVDLAWGGSAALAESGMMNISHTQGDRQVDTGTYYGEKLERLRRIGEALQRYMRRRVDEHGLHSIHVRAPAAELYWAVVGSLVDGGMVNSNAMRREAPDQRMLKRINEGKQSVCDPFWLAKVRGGPLWVVRRGRSRTR